MRDAPNESNNATVFNGAAGPAVNGLIQSAARSATEIAVICDVMTANIDVEGFGRPTPFGWVCGVAGGVSSSYGANFTHRRNC